MLKLKRILSFVLVSLLVLRMGDCFSGKTNFNPLDQVLINPTSYLKYEFADSEIRNVHLCVWENIITKPTQQFIMRYNTFNPVYSLIDVTSGLEVVQNSFINLNSYADCGPTRECSYTYVTI